MATRSRTIVKFLALLLLISGAIAFSRPAQAAPTAGTFTSGTTGLPCPVGTAAERTVVLSATFNISPDTASSGQIWFDVAPASSVASVALATSPFGTTFANSYNTMTGRYQYAGAQLGGDVGSIFTVTFNIVISPSAPVPSTVNVDFVLGTTIGNFDGTQFGTLDFQQVFVTGNNTSFNINCNWSSLPGTYGTAYHLGDGTSGPFLGASWQAGASTLTGTGVTRLGIWAPDPTGGSVQVVVSGAPGYLSGWIDWDNTGSFESEELVISNVGPLVVGTHTLSFSIPPSAIPVPNPLNARFRLYATSQTAAPLAPPAPSGSATGGEVEDYSWPFGPNAVTLASFEAEAQGNDVQVAWETATEWNTAGFFVYRSATPSALGAPVNAQLIAAQGQQGQGAAYTLLDAGLAPGAYFYTLEDVDTAGVRTLHGPVSVIVGDPSAVNLGRTAVSATPSVFLLVLLVGSLAVATGVTALRRRV